MSDARHQRRWLDVCNWALLGPHNGNMRLSGGPMFSRRLAAVVAAIVLAVSAQTSRAAGDRVALVIGNGAYSFATRLPNPTNDAADIAKVLREIGFDVVEGIDLDRRAMEEKIRAFADKLDT